MIYICLYNILYFLWLCDEFFIILFNILKTAELDCCQITSDLRWSDHVNNICGKANRTLGFLRRNLNVGSTSVKENAEQLFAWFSDQVTKEKKRKKGMDRSSKFCKCIIISKMLVNTNLKSNGYTRQLLP
jgi:hypothetical protein